MLPLAGSIFIKGGNMLTTIILFTLSALLLTLSFIKSREKSWESLKGALRMFRSMALELLGLLAIVGLLLSLVPGELISTYLGEGQGWLSSLYGAIAGTLTILPGMVAFPMAAEIYEKGASLTAIAAFITTLTMVGLATLPLEIEHFGKKFALTRNLLSFGFALLVALLLGAIL